MLTIGEFTRPQCNTDGLMHAELAGYLVLLALEAYQREPRRIDAASVQVGFDGRVRLTGEACDQESDAVSSLANLLAALSAPCQVTLPALEELYEAHGLSLDEFQAALRAALIPLNRAASTRALVRLYREWGKRKTDPPNENPSSVRAPASPSESSAHTPSEPVAPVESTDPAREAPSSPPLAVSPRLTTPASSPAVFRVPRPSTASPPPESAAQTSFSLTRAPDALELSDDEDPTTGVYEPRRSDVTELLSGFRTDPLEPRELARELRHMAGLDQEGLTLTPPPVACVTARTAEVAGH